MGSPVSAVVTNLYMEFFEELALESAPSRPRFWKQYVDDTCCIMQRDAVEPLLRHLNEVRPTIKFTMELEKDGSLPFLHTSLTQREDRTLNVTVFRKLTHTDRYLHFNSHHPVSAKRAAVRSLFDRARNITLRKEDLQKNTSPLLSDKTVIPYHSYVPSSPNHLHHQRRSRMRNQTMKNSRRKRSSHWQ